MSTAITKYVLNRFFVESHSNSSDTALISCLCWLYKFIDFNNYTQMHFQ